jgi:hypothetical protein
MLAVWFEDREESKHKPSFTVWVCWASSNKFLGNNEAASLADDYGCLTRDKWTMNEQRHN